MAYTRKSPTFNKDMNGSIDPVKKQSGNQSGYATKTSPLKTGPYEKKMDTIGSGSNRSVRMISGDGKVMGQERLGTQGAEKLTQKYKREKAYTDERRLGNKQFLESREKTGKLAKKSKK